MQISSALILLSDQYSRITDAICSCNWLGGHASVLAMDWYGNETLHRTPLTNITVHGTPVAAVQNVDNFSFACVSALRRRASAHLLTTCVLFT